MSSEINFDYDKPILEQIYNYDWDYDTYSEWVNDPKILTNPVREIIFYHNPVLEVLGKSYWWSVPVVWSVPICYFAKEMTHIGMSATFNISSFFCGLFCWTLVEYISHRFVLHSEDSWMKMVPNTRALFTMHFAMHGVHHAFPYDKHRCAIPTVSAMGIFACFIYPTAIRVVPQLVLPPFMIGLLLGYILYDLIHYYLHFGTSMSAYFRDLKTYHMQHHYKFGSMGYGVSSKLWDIVFGTKIKTKNVT